MTAVLFVKNNMAVYILADCATMLLPLSLHECQFRDYFTRYSDEIYQRRRNSSEYVRFHHGARFYIGDDTFSESTRIVRWEAAMELCLEINCNTEKTRLMYEEHSRFSQVGLSFDRIHRLIGVDHPRDPAPGMAAMPFAYLNLKTGRIESGIWCRGCEHDFLNLVLPQGGWPNPYRFRNKRERAFSEAEFASFRGLSKCGKAFRVEERGS
jgi:hypothetical protein